MDKRASTEAAGCRIDGVQDAMKEILAWIIPPKSARFGHQRILGGRGAGVGHETNETPSCARFGEQCKCAQTERSEHVSIAFSEDYISDSRFVVTGQGRRQRG